MLTTPGGYPYPQETDPLSTYPQTLQYLAEAIEDYAPQAGVTTVTVTAANTTFTKAVTFARPFKSAPTVTVNARVTPPTSATVNAYNVTATGFEVRVVRTAAVDCTVDWLAVRQTQ